MAVYHSYVMSDYTQLNISDNVFYPSLIIMGLIICVMFGNIIINNSFVNNRQKVVNAKPVIGYKKAVLTINAIDANNDTVNLTFRGVGAQVPYNLVDSAKNDVGFNMYKNINDGFNHQQQGNVVLEVLGYGRIEEYEKGYITDNQRVLQIFVNNNGMYGKSFWELVDVNNKNRVTFKKLISTKWSDADGNIVLFSPMRPYSYKDHKKIVTIPAFKPTVLEDNSNILVESK